MQLLLTLARSWLLAYLSVSSFGELHELGRLQGTWVVYDAEVFHFEVGDGPEGSRFVFKGNGLAREGGTDYLVKINSSVDPKELDLVRYLDDLGSKTAELCIYRLEGDRLQICFGGYGRYAADGAIINRESRPRPNKFEFVPGIGRHSYYLKRAR
jgi:uncharacterized protein (TIGR03067 family)